MQYHMNSLWISTKNFFFFKEPIIHHTTEVLMYCRRSSRVFYSFSGWVSHRLWYYVIAKKLKKQLLASVAKCLYDLEILECEFQLQLTERQQETNTQLSSQHQHLLSVTATLPWWKRVALSPTCICCLTANPLCPTHRWKMDHLITQRNYQSPY